MQSVLKLSSLVVGVVSAAVIGRADSKWINPEGGDWSVAGNWDNGVPNAAAAEITDLTDAAAATIGSAVPDVTKVTIRKENRVLITDGGSLKVTGSADGTCDLSNGKLVMTGGSLALPNGPFYSYGTTGGADISGSAAISSKTANFKTGTATFSGTSSLSVSGDFGISGAYGTAKMAFSERARCTVGGSMRLGSYYWASGTRNSYLDIGGGVQKYGTDVMWGYGNGTTIVNISGGAVTGGAYRVAIGSYQSGQMSTKQNPKATVNLTGGEVYVSCSYSTYGTAQKMFAGFTVGNGSEIGTSYFSADGYSCTGRLNISGDTTKLTVGPSFFAVGVGRATGTIVQNGGSVKTGVGMTTDPWRRKEPVMIGQGGGDGTYVISNGSLIVNQPLWIGGVRTNVFERQPIASYPANELTAGRAKGLLEIAGGSVDLPYGMANCVVGADGTGVLRVIAPGAFSTSGHLILSNNVSSTLQIVLGTAGAPTVYAAGLEVASGAKLEVDVSRYAGSERWITLIRRGNQYEMTRMGDFAGSDITIVGNDGNWEVVQHRAGDTKGMLWLHRKVGLAIVVR